MVLICSKVIEKAHDGAVITAMTISPPLNQLITGDSAGHIKLWDLNTLEVVSDLPAYDQNAISSLATFGSLLMAASMFTGTIKIWNLRAQLQLEKEITIENKSDLVAAVLTVDSNSVIFGGTRGFLYRIDLNTEGNIVPQEIFQANIGSITSLAQSNDGGRLAIGGSSGLVIILDSKSLHVLLSLPAHSSAIKSLAFTSDDRFFITGGAADSNIKVFEAKSGNVLFNRKAHQGLVTFVGGTMLDGKYTILSSGFDCLLSSYNLLEGRSGTAGLADASNNATSDAHKAPIITGTVDEVGRRVFTGSLDGSLLIHKF